MKNAVLEQFKIFITLDTFSTAKLFSTFKKSISFYLKCHKICMLYEIFARKKKSFFFFRISLYAQFLRTGSDSDSWRKNEHAAKKNPPLQQSLMMWTHLYRNIYAHILYINWLTTYGIYFVACE